MQVTITPYRPAAIGTASTLRTRWVTRETWTVTSCPVPVAALLALAGGGYAVEVAGPDGGDRLVGVTTGLFANTLVQVSGPGIRAGMKVVTAQ